MHPYNTRTHTHTSNIKHLTEPWNLNLDDLQTYSNIENQITLYLPY